MVMSEQEGNILLKKFELDSNELAMAKQIVGKYAEKINRISPYQELKLEMKVHQKEKNKHFEIKGDVYLIGKIISASAQNNSPFVALNEVLKKLLRETEH